MQKTSPLGPGSSLVVSLIYFQVFVIYSFININIINIFIQYRHTKYSNMPNCFSPTSLEAMVITWM